MSERPVNTGGDVAARLAEAADGDRRQQCDVRQAVTHFVQELFPQLAFAPNLIEECLFVHTTCLVC